MYGQGGYGLASIFQRIFGGGQPSQPQPQPRQVQPYYTGGPATVTNPGQMNATTSGAPPYQDQGVMASGVPRPQEDPLDRFERMARLMEIGERVGAAFDKQPFQLINSGGGVAHPQLPNPQNYGLSAMRR